MSRIEPITIDAADREELERLARDRNTAQKVVWGARIVLQAGDLLRSNDELEQFAYVASHDLKAPLRGIENLVASFSITACPTWTPSRCSRPCCPVPTTTTPC